MINLAKLEYRVHVILRGGSQLDVTSLTTGLGFSEGEKNLSLKIQLKLANAEYKGGTLFEQIQPLTPVFIYSNPSGEFEEVARGNVAKIKFVESNGDLYLDLETNDEAHALRENQDNFYFTDGHSSSSILEEILNKHGVPHEIQIQDATHSKKVYRKKYLSDSIADVLKDLKEKGGGVYFVRAKEGVVQIIPRGTNETVWHFDLDNSLIKVQESFDASKVVTRVQVVGKEKTEAHPRIESTIDGKTQYGTRQVIYERGNKETAGEAETAAKKILEEQGDIKRQTTIDAPDVPTLRKGDRIRIRSSTGTGYFFVKQINHNAVTQRMTCELDEDKDTNSAQGLSYDTSHSNEYNSSSPP